MRYSTWQRRAVRERTKDLSAKQAELHLAQFDPLAAC